MQAEVLRDGGGGDGDAKPVKVGDAAGLGRALQNDLQDAALSLRPSLRAALGAGRDLDALGALVSGSGPTCAFLAASADHASELVTGLEKSGRFASVRQAVGPVPGASLI